MSDVVALMGGLDEKKSYRSHNSDGNALKVLEDDGSVKIQLVCSSITSHFHLFVPWHCVWSQHMRSESKIEN